ncbi:MAG: hypothetical protein ABMB14_13850 [Myxococcota bacterium]
MTTPNDRSEPKAERRRTRVRAVLQAGAGLATTLAVMALASPKVPPLQGD